MYQILGYVVAANTTLLTDAIAIPDSSFSARGGAGGAAHWIFTEPYDLQAVMAAGATITQAQLFDSTYNAINIPQVYPVNLGITPLTNPNIMDLRRQPWPLPMNEEIAFQISGGAGGAEADYGLIWIKPSNNGGTPAPAPNTTTTPRLFANVTANVALLLGAWSNFTPITFVNPLKGGAYQINGAYWVVPNALAYKHNFVKAPLYQGRKLFPGSVVEHAYGNVPWRGHHDWLGPQGRFNNFELPQVSFLGTTATGATTYNGVLDMTYLGTVGIDAQP
jgi:hypothetical protein